MTLKPFTKNFADNSTEAGFQFTFFCDLCGDGFKTSFQASKTYKKGGLLRGLGKAVSVGASLAGKSQAGWAAQSGTDIIGERFSGMSPQWHKEHEAAFTSAQSEAQGHFHRCAKCKKYVCDNDWNEEEGLCVNDAPREAVEVSAARAAKRVEDIQEKAKTTTVFKGEITGRQTTCPKCGKPAGTGKFCNNCGAPLGLVVCPKCGAQNQAGTRFCGECGTKLA
ncbi:MAG: zinc ribbon domain-containing protein [Candidatus Atabeyarchaeum deiterrae]